MNKLYNIPNITNYKINKHGDVYSINTKKYIKPIKTPRGYVSYVLYSNNKRITMFRHRLLCMTFKPNNDKTKNEVDHINGIRGDDRLSNLEWVTRKENVRRYHKNKTKLQLKPVIVKFCKTGEVKEYTSHYEAAKCLGLHRYEILRRISLGESHMHVDYTFIKWKDNHNAFPKITDPEDYRKLSARTNEIVIFNHITNEYRTFSKMKLACNFLNIAPSTLSWKIKHRKNKVFKGGWEAKYTNDKTPWQKLTTIEKIKIANSNFAQRQVAILNTKTNKYVEFPSVKEAAKYLSKGSTLICYRLIHNKVRPDVDGNIYMYLDE